MKYIKSLDTLRFFSFLLVFLGHASLFLDLHFGPWSIGDLGVYIFFVLSGFLITSIILGKNSVEPFSLKNFYVRRIRRIFPLYFLVLILGLIVSKIGVEAFPNATIINHLNIFRYLTFTFNFSDFANNTLILSILWSICVEEQFYWFYPLLFKVFKNLKALSIFLLSLLALSTVLKIIYVNDYNFIYYNTLSVMSYLIFGCLGAILFFYRKSLVERFLNYKSFFISILGFFLILIFRYQDLMFSRYSQAILSLILGLLILSLVLNFIKLKHAKLLTLKPFTYLGKISYGLYVYHIFCFYLVILLVRYLNLPNYFELLLGGIVVIGLASLSYEKFETRFTKRKISQTN